MEYLSEEQQPQQEKEGEIEQQEKGKQRLTIKGNNHIRVLNQEQQRLLDQSNRVVESVSNLVRGTHLKKTEPQIPKIANKMVFALGSVPGRLLVAHNKRGYQKFNENKELVFSKNYKSDPRGYQFCDVAHNGNYYYLVSGTYGGEGGRLYLIKEDSAVEHELTLIEHHYDSPFFGKSIYPNPFDPKMVIFCDACYGWLQAFILGSDEAVQKLMDSHQKKVHEGL